MKFDDLEKASILLGQFSSVFTREKPGDIPRLECRTDSKLCSLDLTTEMVLKELQGININKSCRPDGIHPRLLLELAEIIATPVTMLFRDRAIFMAIWDRQIDYGTGCNF